MNAAGDNAKTRAECAAMFGVSERTVAGWLADPTFPGRAASRGKRDGWFPRDKITAWRKRKLDKAAADDKTPRALDELNAIRAERERFLFAAMQGRLIEVAEVRALIERQVAIAKAILDPLPERVVACLPAGSDDDVRASVSRLVERCLVEAYSAIAETLEGDSDLEQKPKQTKSKTTRAKKAAKRKRKGRSKGTS